MAKKQERAIQLRNLTVKTPDQINGLTNLIHDEWFDLDQFTFDAKSRTATFPYRRKFHDGPEKTLRNCVLYTFKEKDVIRSVLRVHNVIEYHINDPAQVGLYTFNLASFSPSNATLSLFAAPELEMNFFVSDLQVSSEDIEIGGKTRIAYLFGIIELDRGSWNKI